MDANKLIDSIMFFDKMTINAQEGPLGYVGIHVFKKKQTCRYFQVERSQLVDFLENAPEIAAQKWKTPDPLADPCPTCGQSKHAWIRRYQGRAFCGFCGTGLSTKIDSANP